MIKYLYMLPGQHRNNFWGREVEPERISFEQMFTEDLSHYTFFIDNTIPYINNDPDLYENRIALSSLEGENEQEV